MLFLRIVISKEKKNQNKSIPHVFIHVFYTKIFQRKYCCALSIELKQKITKSISKKRLKATKDINALTQKQAKKNKQQKNPRLFTKFMTFLRTLLVIAVIILVVVLGNFLCYFGFFLFFLSFLFFGFSFFFLFNRSLVDLFLSFFDGLVVCF